VHVNPEMSIILALMIVIPGCAAAVVISLENGTPMVAGITIVLTVLVVLAFLVTKH
jgi:hypothetical protein